jgi:hypothetical protein
MEVLGNLLFLSLSSVVLLLFFGFTIHFLVRGLFCGHSRHLLLSLGRDVLWIRIRH